MGESFPNSYTTGGMYSIQGCYAYDYSNPGSNHLIYVISVEIFGEMLNLIPTGLRKTTRSSNDFLNVSKNGKFSWKFQNPSETVQPISEKQKHEAIS